MFGLVIAKHGKDDLVKISSSKDKLYRLAREDIETYLKINKSSLKDTTALNTLKDALSIRDIDAAMDLFGTVTDENGMAIFLVIMKAEIIHDA
jgi:hypothetical protein